MDKMLRNYSLCLIVFGVLVSACSPETDHKYFSLKSSEQTGVYFSNVLPVDPEINILNYMYFYNGGGLAVADLNNDGLQDLVFTSNLDHEMVYLNKGSFKFEDISNIAGIDGGDNSWTNGVTIADVNSDGLLDVYLAQVGQYRNLDSHNKLFVCTHIDEKGCPHYEEKSQAYGLDFKGFSTHAGFFDYDLDGDLDMFLMNHSLHHNGTFGRRVDFENTYDTLSGDRLYRNEGGYFTDVTKESGINGSVIGYGLGLAFSDINLDGWPDIYVGNDFHENDYLYINNGDGSFSEMLNDMIMHTSRFSMGVDIGDLNGDIYPDIISLDMLPEDPVILKSSEGEDALDIFKFKLGYGYNYQYAKNALQLNTGKNAFKEIAAYAGIHATDWSWTPLIFDMDMDGHNDLFVSNGIPKRMNDIDYINFISNSDIQYKIQFDQLTDEDLKAIDKIPEIKLFNKFYLNKGRLEFEDISTDIAESVVSYSNSAVYADLDNDGDYDLVSNNINDKAFIYENLADAPSVVCLLNGPASNKYAIGAKLIVYSGERKLLFERFNTRGFQSSGLHNLRFAKSLNPDSVTVVWPDRKSYTITNISGDTLIFQYDNHHDQFDFGSLKLKSDYSLEELSSQLELIYNHDENPFVEFNREALIPHSSSSDGPAVAVADFNQDGLEDIFIGSSKRRWNKIFYQKSDGLFEDVGDIGIDSTYEEVDAVVLELNKNEWPDLVIANGGNEFRLESKYNQPIIVYDFGSGQPKYRMLDIHMTASCVEASDFDDDGDTDLFFCARAFPRSYGAPVVSFLMLNDGNGNFSAASKEVIPGLADLGMIRDACVSDINEDGIDELVVAEEWGGIYAFVQEADTFKKLLLCDRKGWWNHIASADFDGDGDMDLLAGNLGLNSRLKPTRDEPVRMYYNDFDDNGNYEQILTYYLDGKEVPFSNFKELTKQIPKLKKEFLYAKDFANASIEELFGADKIRSAKVYEFNFAASVVLENTGEMNFKLHELPDDIQYSPVYASHMTDLNGDELPEILLGGNYYDCNIQMGRYDADYGSLLINEGNFKFRTASLSGYKLKNQVKHLTPVRLSNSKELIVVGRNNDRLALIDIKKYDHEN